MFKKLVFVAVAAAVAFGMGATAHAQPKKTKFIAARDHARLAGAAELVPQVGNERWVVLLCRFTDSPAAVPFPRTDYISAFNTDPKSHAKYFKEASYGQLNITATVKEWR